MCAATSSSEPVALAAEVARDRATVVVVGDVGLELDRRVMYEKELDLVVARSYGPGRYERAYEERGLDFPVGHVRWTEGRNVEAILDLVASGSIALGDLVTHCFPIEDAENAYSTLLDDPSALGIMLEYETPAERSHVVRRAVAPARVGVLRVALLGTGSFARSTLVPAIQAEEDLSLAAVCARTGASATSLADKLDVPVATTDWRAIVASDEIDAVVIATPHSSHAPMAAAALTAGKSVWVEKPLAITWDGLAEVAAAGGDGVLVVGHNRRFAPLAVELREALHGPKSIQIRVAAGPLAEGHWLEDPEEGGRVLGEISHFVDLASFLAGSSSRGGLGSDRSGWRRGGVARGSAPVRGWLGRHHRLRRRSRRGDAEGTDRGVGGRRRCRAGRLPATRAARAGRKDHEGPPGQGASGRVRGLRRRCARCGPLSRADRRAVAGGGGVAGGARLGAHGRAG